MALDTPIVFLIFNRPETTRQVFEEIARAQPRTLFVVADGPRVQFPDDVVRVEQTRAIVEKISWDCDVKRNYSETNLGLRARISSGLDWVFETAEEAIILEDDCLPHPSFFPYCETLLDFYRDNDRIMHISGDNFLHGAYPSPYSYYFTRYPHSWGWATWQRAWARFDVNLTPWLDNPDLFLTHFEDDQERELWRSVWDGVAAGRIDSWAYAWVFACVAHNGLCINPERNLISNIGFNSDATHTRETESYGSNIAIEGLSFPLRHPPVVQQNEDADQIVAEKFFQRRTLKAQLDAIKQELQRSEEECLVLKQQLERSEADRAAMKQELQRSEEECLVLKQQLARIRSRTISRIMERLGKPLV